MAETRTDWNTRFMALAEFVATWSKDPSTQVGAVIIDERRNVCGLGYNGFPRGVEDTAERYQDRETKYAMIVHSEANAILNAERSVRGGVLYCTKFPCTACAKLIIQAGIKRVITPEISETNAMDIRWAKDTLISQLMLFEAGVITRYLVDGELRLPKVPSTARVGV